MGPGPIISALKGVLDKGNVSNIAGELGVDAGQANKGIGSALSIFLTGMSKKMAGGGLNLGELAGMDGKGIVGSIFGNDAAGVSKMVGMAGGMEADKGLALVEKIAPSVVGTLNKVKGEQNLDDAGLADLMSKDAGMLSKITEMKMDQSMADGKGLMGKVGGIAKNIKDGFGGLGK